MGSGARQCSGGGGSSGRAMGAQRAGDARTGRRRAGATSCLPSGSQQPVARQPTSIISRGATPSWSQPRPRRPGKSLSGSPAAGIGAAGDVRQGHRAWHPRLHDRGPVASRARPEGCHSFRAVLRSGRGGGLPTALTLASADDALARALCDVLHGSNLRLYHSTDVRGVEIGGAAKNVLAIACGVAIGRGLGESASAALIARGFAELRRFGEAFGARASTLMGLSGLGDLVSDLLFRAVAQLHLRSRARKRRERSQSGGEGRLVEGVFTAPALSEMARARDVDLPIANCVAEALIEGSLDCRRRGRARCLGAPCPEKWGVFMQRRGIVRTPVWLQFAYPACALRPPSRPVARCRSARSFSRARARDILDIFA